MEGESYFIAHLSFQIADAALWVGISVSHLRNLEASQELVRS